ncbi:MAG: flagellar basal body L-ring protein FlgH [Phycisphaerales bacterium]|nr:flagellar basal body L-ring protein FlgH [Phycisphaerales bacterium]
MSIRTAPTVLAMALLAMPAAAQSLYERPVAPARNTGPMMRPTGSGSAPGQPAPATTSDDNSGTEAPPGEVVRPAATPAPTQAVSLFHVEPPEPVTFKQNDLVTIIISERSQIDRTQKLEGDKSVDANGQVVSFPDLVKLLTELRAENGRESNLPKVNFDFESTYDGEGKYKRDDKLTARLTARVLEVKPNGTLLLEARTAIKTDDEDQVMVLSGVCRPEDITNFNTVQSNQMFDLNLVIENKGTVAKNAEKGILTKIFDTIFAF